MKKLILGLSLALVAATGISQAQTNNAPRGNGNGNGYYNNGGWCGGGMGYGHGHREMGRGHMMGGRHMGMGYMNPAEMNEMQDKIYSSKSYNECKKVQETNHKEMVKRAKAQGVNMPSDPPRAGICERLSDQGYFGN